MEYFRWLTRRFHADGKKPPLVKRTLCRRKTSLLTYILKLIGRIFYYHEWSYIKKKIDDKILHLKQYPQNIPPLILQHALLSGEDHRFFDHPGYDKIAICRAIWKRITKSSREGASTIEQQLVRIITGDRRYSMKRKIKEISLAVLLVDEYPKLILPSIYLHLSYFGWRMNGILQACERLNISFSNMSIHEAVSLIARLKYPEPRMSPITRKTQIRRRANYILQLYKKHIKEERYECFTLNSTKRNIFARTGFSVSRA